jgi:hypothetical protein
VRLGVKDTWYCEPEACTECPVDDELTRREPDAVADA